MTIACTALAVLALPSVYGFQGQHSEDWTNYARIAGFPLAAGNAGQIVKTAAESHVSAIASDNDIPGRYESFLDPAEKLKAIRAMADAAHAAGNHASVYIAGLECITSGADKKPHSFFKDHPDWVQRNKAGEPAMFGGGAAFWVRAGDEDVWISPYAMEWRKRFMTEVRQIAATGIDGIYVDIPYWMTIYRGWDNSWASFDDYTVAAFRAKTGLDARKDVKLGDFTDRGFLRWIDFRIATVTDFMREIDQNAKAANPRCATIAEIYPGIEEDAIHVGADVYQLYTVVDAISHEYEYGNDDPDAVSPMAANRTTLDWIHYMAGMCSFRAFAAGRASWILNYSWERQPKIVPGEAMKNLIMSELMAGANPWDTRGHGMSGSNDIATRTAVFGWIAAHEKTFYRPRTPVHPIGVYFSPSTRNYFPKDFVDAYVGAMALLLQGHLEFQVVTPRTLAAFHGEALILPDVRCISDAEVNAITSYFKSGKALVVGGETGKYSELREARKQNPILKLLGTDGTAHRESSAGRARFIFDPQAPGRAYVQKLAEEASRYAVEGDYRTSQFNGLLEQFEKQIHDVLKFEPALRIEASPFVVSQLARADGKLHIFMANFRGLKGGESAVQTPEPARIVLPAGFKGRAYALPFLGEVTEITLRKEGGNTIGVLPQIQKGMAVWLDE
jgi:hypothetical protein